MPVPAASTPLPASARTTIMTCQSYEHADMVVPVDDQGRQTDVMPEQYSTACIVRRVQRRHPARPAARPAPCLPARSIVHTYPHCWRCKKPIIFRATPQWFCSVDAFKDDAVKACDDVDWMPGMGQGPHDLHDPASAPTGASPVSAHWGLPDSRVLLRGLRQARLHG